MNRTSLLGRLTRDPELRFAAGSGTAVCRFTLAVNRPRKKDGQTEADFISCVAFGKTAETIAQYVAKGRQLAIAGSIRTGSYDAQDGTKRYTTDVFVESFDFIGTSNGSINPAPGAASYDSDMTPINNDDVPF